MNGAAFCTGGAPRRDRAEGRFTGLAAGFAAELVARRVARGRTGTVERGTNTRGRGVTRCWVDPPRGRAVGAGSGFGNAFASGVGSGLGVTAGADALNTSATAASANVTPECRSNDEEPQAAIHASPTAFVACSRSYSPS
jgi:hypothetical protein